MLLLFTSHNKVFSAANSCGILVKKWLFTNDKSQLQREGLLTVVTCLVLGGYLLTGMLQSVKMNSFIPNLPVSISETFKLCAQETHQCRSQPASRN